MSGFQGWSGFAALEASHEDLAVLPIREDGSKAPDVRSWKRFSGAPPGMEELSSWFSGRRTGLALACGRGSGGLELFEFEGRAVAEGVHQEFVELIRDSELGEVWARIDDGYVEESPSGGLHYLFRVEEPAGSMVLAKRPSTAEELDENSTQTQVLIETKGQGGYVIVAPSSGKVHETGKPWRRLRGMFADIPTISTEERDAIYALARSLSRVPPKDTRWGTAGGSHRGGPRPGDAYNSAPDAQEVTLALLERHGWEIVSEDESGYRLCRPGKDGGVSATLGYCGPGVLYVFSTSTGFESDAAYSPFAVLATLEHDGDYSAAARALRTEGFGDPAQGPPSGQSKKSQGTRMVELAESSYDFGISTDGMTFAVRREGVRVARHLSSSAASALKSELSNRFYEEYGSVPTGNAVTDALRAVEGRALRAEDRQALHRRVALRDGEVWLDLGNSDGVAVHIDSDGWRLAEPPLLFVRSESALPLPMPEPGGDVEALAQLVNIRREHFDLLVAWLVAGFIEDIPHPLLNINGEHGSGKSMFSRFVVRLLDPSAAELRAISTNLEDWAVAANDAYVVALDNVSTISQAMSDAFCRAVTGGGVVRRRRWSDSDTTVLSFRRVVLVNNIGLKRVAGDLADRMLSIELDRITDSDRMTEKELTGQFERDHPRLLGALLVLVAETLKALPEVQLDGYPRMADFARVVAAVDSVRGTDALTTYMSQGDERATSVVEGDIVGMALRSFLDERGSWRGAASELLKELGGSNHVASDAKYWPGTPEAMGKALKELAPALRQLRYTVDRSRTGSARTWHLSAPQPE